MLPVRLRGSPTRSIANHSPALPRISGTSSWHPTTTLQIGAMLLVYLFGVFSSLPGSESSAEIHGVVLTTDGAPLIDASVQIKISAPSRVEEIANRPNLQTSAMTDASGRFTFRNLPTGFKFTLIAVKPDYLPEITERVAAGSDSLTFRLKPINPPGESRTQTLRGRIKRPDGSPLPGALINILVFYSGISSRMGSDGISDTTVTTDDTGHFTIRSAMTVDAITGYVSAPGFARQAIRLTRGQDHEVTMNGGSSLTGRILHQGKPASKIKVGITPRGQRMDQSVGLFDATTTDADGRFKITHLPSDADYTLYAKMDVTSPGIFPDRAVHVGGEKHTTDL
ncbi:MAG TPA: carboxypeptidase regulatory-like domain-containing protein, partial [Opitutaceae bacterium]|nr:carboxypeptidase regulatory-like domain-containing protein [Opitutaceae bacterium]